MRQAIEAERFSRGLSRKIVRLLNSADAEIQNQILDRYAKMTERGFDTGPATTARLVEMQNTLREINDRVYSRAADGLETNLVGLAEHEAAQTAKTFAVNIPPAQYLATLVKTSPFEGHLFDSWFAEMPRARLARLTQVVRIGLVNSSPIEDIARGVRKALNISRYSAMTIALTSSSTISNRARYETAITSGVVRFVEWSSVLDGRTTPHCQSLSGKIWPVHTAHPIPPGHHRCRSLLIFHTEGDGTVPRHRTYEQYFNSLDEAEQNARMGKGRAALYRSGDIPFDELFRYEQTRTYKSLDQLRAQFPAAA
jgi:SPP1 gp7 family putative phage head morphogenesis protein